MAASLRYGEQCGVLQVGAVLCALTVALLPTGGHARRGGSSHSRTGPRGEHW